MLNGDIIMFKSLRIRIVYFVAGLLQVPIKIKDTYWGKKFDCANSRGTGIMDSDL